MDRGDLAPGGLSGPTLRRHPTGCGAPGRPAAGLLFVTCLLILGLHVPLARAGHEMPFYPSYYPQEITVRTLSPGPAAAGLENRTLHAWLGPDPFGSRTPPPHALAVETFGGWVVLTFNPARVPPTEAARCAAARAVTARLRPVEGFTPHPSPVTPYHADYLHHVDLIERMRAGAEAAGPTGRALRLRARGPLAARLTGAPAPTDDDWEAAVEDVGVAELLAGTATSLNGWLGPPWLKQGWFHAYLLQQSAVSDGAARRRIDELYRRLTVGDLHEPVERINTERALVGDLARGCERVVLGYARRRQYLNDDYSAGVENAARDAHFGLGSAIFVRTVKLKDFPWNGWMTLGLDDRPRAAWNPVGGFTDAAGRLIWLAVGDPALFPEPGNASWISNRVRVAAVDRGPLAVPPDAVRPEPATGRLREIGPGRTARARLAYRVLTSAFHDGTRTTTADLLYALAFAYARGAGAGPRGGDPAVARATAQLREWLVGLKVTGVEEDVLRFGDVVMKYAVPLVDVYLDHALPDPQQLAAVSPPWTAVPWHVLALMDEAVRQGLAAFSLEEARRHRRPWLDLARDARLRARLGALVDRLEARSHVPPPLEGRVTPAEARERWAALKRFARRHGHYLVTNGPYVLHAWSPTATVLRVFRDFSYPLGVGSYNAWATPLRAYAARTAVRADALEVEAEVERIERFARETRIVTEPLAAPPRSREPVVRCRWVVVADGAVTAAGAAEPDARGRFTVPLAGARGPRLVLLALTVDDYLANADIRAVRVD